jgi:hypothetical protein
VKAQNQVRASWYATRTIPMPDQDEKGIDSILIWIEHRKEDGQWAVGRASDLAQRDFSEPQPHDYIFEGYDIDECLERANEALEDDATASELDGLDARVRAFLRSELEQPLNEWFWGRRAN